MERTGGLLEERSARYSITPAGEEQFYGATNVVTFQPGQRQATASVVAIPDKIPEVSGLGWLVWLVRVFNASMLLLPG